MRAVSAGELSTITSGGGGRSSLRKLTDDDDDEGDDAEHRRDSPRRPRRRRLLEGLGHASFVPEAGSTREGLFPGSLQLASASCIAWPHRRFLALVPRSCASRWRLPVAAARRASSASAATRRQRLERLQARGQSVRARQGLLRRPRLPRQDLQAEADLPGRRRVVHDQVRLLRGRLRERLLRRQAVHTRRRTLRRQRDLLRHDERLRGRLRRHHVHARRDRVHQGQRVLQRDLQRHGLLRSVRLPPRRRDLLRRLRVLQPRLPRRHLRRHHLHPRRPELRDPRVVRAARAPVRAGSAA